MSDKNYSVDDILAELEKKHTSDRKEPSYPSVTQIIGSDALENASGGALEKALGDVQKNSENKKEPQKEKQIEKTVFRETNQKKSNISPSKPKNEEKYSRDEIIKTQKEKEEVFSSPKIKEEVFETGNFEIIDEEMPFKKEKPVQKNERQEFKPKPVFPVSSISTETQQIKKQKKIEEINKALLRKDIELNSPEEMLDSINPLEQTQSLPTDVIRAAEAASFGDTLAVAGNDFKKLSGKEEIKQYTPAPKARKQAPNQEPHQSVSQNALDESVSERERRSNAHLVEVFNQRKKEERQKNIETIRTATLSGITDSIKLPPHALNIDYSKQIIGDTGVMPLNDPVIAVQEMEELEKKRKRKIRDFVIVDIDEETKAEEPRTDENEDEEDEDLDDTNVIWKRLCIADKGLVGRILLLLSITVFGLVVGIMNDFKMDIPLQLFDRRYNVDAYLYTFLVIGILAFGICRSVITNGLAKLVTLKADSDSICALSLIASMVSIVVYLVNPNYIQMGISHIYMNVSLVALLFNTIGKLLTVKCAKRNFKFTAGDSAKYSIEVHDDDDAVKMTRGSTSGLPVLAAMRKTEYLSDFLQSTYCTDISDKVSGIIAPISILAALVLGVLAYTIDIPVTEMKDKTYWAITVANSVFAIMAPFSSMLIVNFPLFRASRAMAKRNSAILGYGSVEDFNDINSVVVDAALLFPSRSVVFKNMKRCQKVNSPTKVEIDEAIIYASSLAIKANSIMSKMFLGMIDEKRELLHKVSGCIYEDGMGITGWIGNRRMMLGNREQMKSHNIAIPDIVKEQKYNKSNSEVVYLAVAGEAVAMFFVELQSNTEIAQYVKSLENQDISIIIKTVDSMVTQSKISEMFDITPELVRVIPFGLHEKYDEYTKYASRGSGSLSCDGTFSAFVQSILGVKSLSNNIMFGVYTQIAGIVLGVLLIAIFSLFVMPSMFSCLNIILFNLAWVFLTVIIQSIKRY